jgi:hypothetical protein
MLVFQFHLKGFLREDPLHASEYLMVLISMCQLKLNKSARQFTAAFCSEAFWCNFIDTT